MAQQGRLWSLAYVLAMKVLTHYQTSHRPYCRSITIMPDIRINKSFRKRTINRILIGARYRGRMHVYVGANDISGRQTQSPYGAGS